MVDSGWSWLGSAEQGPAGASHCWMIPPYAGFGEQWQWPLHPQMPPSLSLTGYSERSELCTPSSSFRKLLVPGALAGTLLATLAYPSLGIPLWEAVLITTPITLLSIYLPTPPTRL